MHVRPDWPRKAAAKIRDAVQQLQMHGRVEVEGFAIERIADAAEPVQFFHTSSSVYLGYNAAGGALAALLRDKHAQLDVDGRQRFLIAVNRGSFTHTSDVADACAFIDFRQYPNFDRIYFEEAPGSFQLVYDREAWHAMEARNLPENMEARALVVRWLEIRLSRRWPGALDAVLQISWELHSVQWLSEGGRATLDLEAQLYFQRCTWNTPRQLWELVRGPGPIVLDRRPKAHPIVV